MEDQRRRGVFAGINVTPMADIMIVLLVIFMAVTSCLVNGIPVVLPRVAHSKQGGGDITVTLGRNLVRVLNGVTVRDDGELEARLRAILSRPAGGTVYVKADTSLPYAEVGGVLEACRGAGAEEITLVGEPRK
jgi:biopolymer transport protein ExbD